MKSLVQNRLMFLSGILCIFSMADGAKAAGQYFDVNGTAPGYGIVNGGTYSWDDANWATLAGGGNPTGLWIPGSFANFPGGASGQSYTVTLNNSESMAGLFGAVSNLSLIITAAGSGNLNLAPGAQGFLISGPTTITAPITGVGGIAPEASNLGLPAFRLYGTNTYSGGTYFGNGNAPLTYFNNNNSFGTGPIIMTVPSGRFWSLFSAGGVPITLPNAFTNTVSGGGLMFAIGTNTPVICTGDWGLGSNNVAIVIRNNGDTTASLTLAGSISGTAKVTFSGTSSSGIITLSGTNIYTGTTTVSLGTGGLVVATNGSLAGNVTVTSGFLELDQPAALKSTATLSLVSTLASGAVHLNFSGVQAINALSIDSIFQAPGTWGSPASGAQHTSLIFTGTSVLNVAAPPVALQLQQQVSGQWQLLWSGAGALQASGDVEGIYTNVPGANSPYAVPTSLAPSTFYRLKY